MITLSNARNAVECHLSYLEQIQQFEEYSALFQQQHFLSLAHHFDLRTPGLQQVLGEGVLRHQVLPELGQLFGAQSVHGQGVNHAVQLIQDVVHFVDGRDVEGELLDELLVITELGCYLLEPSIEQENLHILDIELVLKREECNH